MNNTDSEFNAACDSFNDGEYDDVFNTFKKLADEGHIGAILRTADCFLRGIGVEKDIDRAREYFAIAQNCGVGDAEEILQLIEKGQELEVDHEFWRNYQG